MRVAILAPGSHGDTEHAYMAGQTLGETSSESAAIAMAKAANKPAGIIAADGVFFVYRLIGPAGLKASIVAHRGVRVDEGVIAMVVGANVYRPGASKVEASAATMRAYGDPFAPYHDLLGEEGGLRTDERGKFVSVFEAAMRDNALAILAESQARAEAKRTQFSAGPTAVRTEEQDTIEQTAIQAREVQKQIELHEEKVKRVQHSRAVSGNRSKEDISWSLLTQHQDQLKPLVQKRKQIDLRYPMIGRYRTVESLDEFLARDRSQRIHALAGDASSVIDNIRETRSHLLAGKLDLWTIPGVVDSTMAGLGIEKDSPQRGWIEERAAAEAKKDKIRDIALAAFSVGLGLAAAFTTGGLSLALTAGALGMATYDAIQVTERHQVNNPATDTDLDPTRSVLPEDLQVHWGWLVLAWVGLGLDASAVVKAVAHAGQAGRGARTAQVVEQAAEALAAKDQALLARLRKAAGKFELDDVVSDANREELGRLVGASITIESAPVGSVRVRYDVDEVGRTYVTGIEVGSRATAGDILSHAETIRLLQRRSRLVERIEDLWTRIRTFGKKGATIDDNPFPAGQAGFESWREIHKLKNLMAIKRARIEELLTKGADARVLQTELRTQLANLDNELQIHTAVVNTAAASKAGRGFIAMSDDTRAAIKAGKRLPDIDKPAEALTDADIAASNYYYVRNGDSYEPVAKPARSPAPHSAGPVGAAEFHDPNERAIAEFLERLGRRVSKNALEGMPGAGRQGDAFVDGLLHEFKTLDPGAGPGTIKNSVNNSIRRGGQAREIVMDARGTGLTMDDAKQGAAKALGISRGKLDGLTIIGDGYFFRWTPR